MAAHGCKSPTSSAQRAASVQTLTVLSISATARSTRSREPLTVMMRSLSLGVSSDSGCVWKFGVVCSV